MRKKFPHGKMETYEEGQPWVTYTYGLTHDRWWPLRSSTHVTGRAKIIAECLVCGDTEVLVMKMPRLGEIEDRGPHPQRLAYLAKHAHPDRGHPMSWAKPLKNMVVFDGGISLDLLAMRIQADLREGRQ